MRWPVKNENPLPSTGIPLGERGVKPSMVARLSSGRAAMVGVAVGSDGGGGLATEFDVRGRGPADGAARGGQVRGGSGTPLRGPMVIVGTVYVLWVTDGAM